MVTLMNKKMPIVVLFVLTVFSSSTNGEDKIVVIPLGAEVNIEAPIRWQSEWTGGASYKKGDGLQYNGSSYICLQEHVASTINAPPNDSFWSLMATKGDKGDYGNTGPQGIPGPVGATGPQGIPGPVGAAGPQGIPGPVGATGPQGIPGPVGATGPQGIQGPAGSSGIQVYDANNQNLGMLLSFTETGNYFTVFNSGINLPIRISKDTGELYKDGSLTGIHINTVNCGNNPSHVRLGSAGAGLLEANPHSPSSGTFPYVSYEYPRISFTPTSWSYRRIDGQSSCVPNQEPTVENVSSIKYYTAAEVPLTFPIVFPLRFETPQ